jgi:lipopolysaccharide/colanic/teichoic acid biosynthesis glycosyltransferase
MFKRLLDLTLSSLALIILSPFFLVLAMLIRKDGGPVLFRQERVGQGGEIFRLLKFRSMIPGGERMGAQVTAKNDSRITRVGRLLRKTKMDELPELWNVVRGDLSLVGPRPEVPRYVDLDNPMWKAVLNVEPGITDPVTLWLRNEEELLAGVKGDQERFYQEVLQPVKLKKYKEYLDNRSAWTDLKVLVDSVLAVLLPGRTPPPTSFELEKTIEADKNC